MTTPENIQTAEQTQQQIAPQAAIEQPKEEAPKNSQQWENFRQARAAERKQAEEVARQAEKNAFEANALRAALEAALNKQQPIRQGYGEDLPEETEEARIDKRVAEALAKREADYERLRRERELQEYPERLQRTFGDFQQVCTTDNLDYLEYHYPEVAEAFKYAPEGFDKWAAVYKAVKRFVPVTDSKRDLAKAERNLSKPGSVSAPAAGAGGGTQTPSFKLDEQRKAANWERMQRAMKGLS